MTEVPEHLLKRSLDRRAALGLGGDGGGGDTAPVAGEGPAASASTDIAAAAPAAAAALVEKPPPEPEFVPPYVRASEQRQRIPIWAMPVLAFLPVWAVIYAQSLSAAPSKEVTQLAAGAAVFSPCASCHGSGGGGGTGRKLSEGEVLKTFPNIAGQLQYVRLGDAGINGPYGNPSRDGGQHAGPYNGANMPAFPALTDKELLEVVRHERETLSGEKEDFKVDATGNRLWPNGKPMLNAAGKLVWDDGTLMFDADGQFTKPVDQSKPPAA